MNAVNKKNTKNTKNAKNTKNTKNVEVMAGDLSKRLIYLSVSLNISETKLIEEISLLTNESFSRYHLASWKDRGDKMVKPSKVSQMDFYFKTKGLSLLKSSIEEFKRSVDECVKDSLGQGKDFHKSNDEEYHPHTTVIDSFDDLKMAEVKVKEDNMSSNDFLAIMFKNLLGATSEDFEKMIAGHLKLTEVYSCVQNLRSAGGE